jgi:hypothetical protein
MLKYKAGSLIIDNSNAWKILLILPASVGLVNIWRNQHGVAWAKPSQISNISYFVFSPKIKRILCCYKNIKYNFKLIC